MICLRWPALALSCTASAQNPWVNRRKNKDKDAPVAADPSSGDTDFSKLNDMVKNLQQAGAAGGAGEADEAVAAYWELLKGERSAHEIGREFGVRVHESQGRVTHTRRMGALLRLAARVRAGEADPPCPTCGGILKSATISFGQSLIAEDLQRAERAAVECDLFLAVGTSLAVFPINETIKVAHQTGSKVIILNGEATVFDPIADVVLHAGISETLPRIVRAVA